MAGLKDFLDALAYGLVQLGIICALLDFKVQAVIMTGISIPIYALSKILSE